jgi:predicted transcriptional regulator
MMNENSELPEPKNRVWGRTRLMEFLGIAAARLTTVRRFAPAIPRGQQIHVDPEHHEVLRRLASERQTTVSALVASAIHDWLARETKPPKRQTARGKAPQRGLSRPRKDTRKERSKAAKPGAPAELDGTEES